MALQLNNVKLEPMVFKKYYDFVR